MASVTSPPLTSTWRLLGLSVAVGYIGLGSLATFRPDFSTRFFIGDELGDADAREPRAQKLLPALGARDLSIGAALAAFHYYDMHRPMAILILSGMILCIEDVGLVYRYRGPRDGSILGVGAAFWGYIGWELWRRT